eukprot:114689-Pyramimonas_sp.AAC.1
MAKTRTRSSYPQLTSSELLGNVLQQPRASVSARTQDSDPMLDSGNPPSTAHTPHGSGNAPLSNPSESQKSGQPQGVSSVTDFHEVPPHITNTQRVCNLITRARRITTTTNLP